MPLYCATLHGCSLVCGAETGGAALLVGPAILAGAETKAVSDRTSLPARKTDRLKIIWFNKRIMKHENNVKSLAEEQLGRRPQLFASFVQSHNDKIQYFVQTAARRRAQLSDAVHTSANPPYCGRAGGDNQLRSPPNLNPNFVVGTICLGRMLL